ncbi:MAG: NifB/NifX family molybdenum-iron cluster-binding protein [Thermodesulfobacteriota bacterium]|nr:NifB/NifX family molybdenum-iron cluster-binding protein [Thermodesulfobacteriota bacterium]
MELLMGISTDDGEHMINDHAGQAKYFDVYRLSDGEAQFLERRANSKYKGNEALKHGDPKKAQATMAALEGLHVLVAKTYGPNLPRLLKKLLCVVIRTKKVSDAVEVMKGHADVVWKAYEKGEARRHLVLEP